MEFKIDTVNAVYYFKADGNGRGSLKGGRIKGDGVKGLFIEPLDEGTRPVFLTLEPCVLMYDNKEAEVKENGGIQLSTIVKVEQIDEVI